ncbi:DUF4301 family protein [Carboxylicivirga taeanensis]|uniref:DUF4301 family protein n=1 Tax=Carboxylicivirga taeanensis TaxID=1416875 RepID=UPI003F6DE9D1
MLTKSDLNQIQQKAIDSTAINQQINHFINGFEYALLLKAATVGDGIIRTDKALETNYIDYYKHAQENGISAIKFVPASGAATRMFKALFEFLHADETTKADLLKQAPYAEFFAQIRNFAFISDLEKSMKCSIEPSAIDAALATQIIEHLLLSKGLNYGSLPKGLLQFHKAENTSATPLEEHLKETALYATISGIGKVHFTVSPEHYDLFNKQLQKSQRDIEQHYQTNLQVSFSFQKQSTDTIAVTPDNEPFRKEDGTLLFRPAGHGALIENLNELEEELIFIKNIDNVVPEHLQNDTVYNKQLLAGVLLSKKDQVFSILNELDKGLSEDAIHQGLDFLNKELQVDISAIKTLSPQAQKELIMDRLNRPMRVCGMVKNEGEPGGGPFWVKQKDGSASLQIVEGAQIDPNDEQQQQILKSSTHFNPVDLVCYTKDYKGQKFDLLQFVDPETGFISQKTQNGKALKALELPGLWNGAMAHWLTFFVEVPVSTFNPVKTVMDLLRPQHQPLK